MQKAVEQHGAPEFLRSDNGSEFIAKSVQRWLKMNRIETINIDPGNPANISGAFAPRRSFIPSGSRWVFVSSAQIVPACGGCARPERIGFFQTYLTGHALRIGITHAPKITRH